jgi:hypothetical protein
VPGTRSRRRRAARSPAGTCRAQRAVPRCAAQSQRGTPETPKSNPDIDPRHRAISPYRTSRSSEIDAARHADCSPAYPASTARSITTPPPVEATDPDSQPTPSHLRSLLLPDPTLTCFAPGPSVHPGRSTGRLARHYYAGGGHRSFLIAGCPGDDLPTTAVTAGGPLDDRAADVTAPGAEADARADRYVLAPAASQSTTRGAAARLMHPDAVVEGGGRWRARPPTGLRCRRLGPHNDGERCRETGNSHNEGGETADPHGAQCRALSPCGSAERGRRGSLRSASSRRSVREGMS